MTPTEAKALSAAYHDAYRANGETPESKRYSALLDKCWKQADRVALARQKLEAEETKLAELQQARTAAGDTARNTHAARALDYIVETIKRATGQRWLEDCFPILNDMANPTDEAAAD